MGIVWCIVLRTGQTLIEASSTIVVGLIVAAVFERMIGSEGTRRLFGGAGLKGLFRAWVIGTLLPVCSLGVIPVICQMRRAGVPPATILAFVLAAPQLNPLSFLYGITLSEPIVIISFVGATMVIAILGGEIWKWLDPTQTSEVATVSTSESLPAPGIRRLLSLLVSASRTLVGPAGLYMLLGIVGTGLIAGLIPFGALSTTMRHEDWRSPLLMTLIGFPIYSGVLPGMMRIGLMFDHGNSVGAAFTLFELGVGFNLGLLLWLMHTFGYKRILIWITIIISITLCVAYLSENTLYFAKEQIDHTHAFDDWSSPFPSYTDVQLEMVWKKLLQKIEILEPVALAILAVFVGFGVLLAVWDRHQRLEAFLLAPPTPPTGPPSIWNREVPGPVLGICILLGLIAFSVVALFIYYPAPQDTFEEMVRVYADTWVAVRMQRREEAIRLIERWDLLTRKLQVGDFLRTGRIDAEAVRRIENLRERLEQLRDALLDHQMDQAKGLLEEIERAYRQCRNHYRQRELSEAEN